MANTLLICGCSTEPQRPDNMSWERSVAAGWMSAALHKAEKDYSLFALQEHGAATWQDQISACMHACMHGNIAAAWLA